MTFEPPWSPKSTWHTHWRRPVSWVRQQEPALLLALLLVVTGTWAFLELADEVLEGSTQHLDERIVQMFRHAENRALPLGPYWLAEMGRDITALGSHAVVGVLVTAVLGFLWLQKQYKTMLLIFLAVTTGILLSTLLKDFFARPRPDFVPHAATMTQSFPSGHSMLSAVIYPSLGALLAQREPRRRLKVYYLSVALGLAFLVGCSRVYLGVHFPSDVLAGWTVGLVWAVLWWLIARYLWR